MTWHKKAVRASCLHHTNQLAALPQEPWIVQITHLYGGVNAFRLVGPLTPLAAPFGYESAINELTLGLGSDAKNARGLIFGLEAAYDVADVNALAWLPEGKASYVVEGCALSALWQQNASIAAIADLAASAMAPAPWPTALLSWAGQAYQFFRNPSHHYRLRAGHTWRKLAKVASGGDMDALFDSYYVLDLSHRPRKRNVERVVSTARLAFLTQLVTDYAGDNPTGKLWFHGTGWPARSLHGVVKAGANVRTDQATRILMNAFLGVGAPLELTREVKVPSKNGKVNNRFECYDHGGRTVVFSYHASGSTRVPAEYWSQLAKVF